MEKDYIEIGAATGLGLFNKRLAEVAMKFSKMNKPFDEPCARIDFRDKVETMEKESQRRNGFVKVDELKLNIEKIDLEKYGAEDRFEFVSDNEDVTEKFLDGTRTRVVLGHTIDFRCKNRGHGISLFIPLADYIKSPINVKAKSNKEKEE